MRLLDHQAEDLAKKLSALVKAAEDWTCDFDDVPIVDDNGDHFVVEYRDSGVGEDYVRAGLAKSLGCNVEVETEGGCDTCGFNRLVTVTVHRPLAGVV